jgi:hypothetical protein
MKLRLKNGNTSRGSYEIDIFVPELKKGIEFNGTYWHSIEALRRSKRHLDEYQILHYHEIKRAFFENKGINYLDIWEHDFRKARKKCMDQIWEFLSGVKYE